MSASARRTTLTCALASVLATLAVPALAQTVLVTSARGANLREKPDRASEVVGRVAGGGELELIDRKGDWLEVVAPASGEPAWIHVSAARILDEGSAAPPVTVADPDLPEADADDPSTAPRRPGFWSRFSLVAGGTLATAAATFEGQRRVTEFVEEGFLASAYSPASGPGFELGLEYRFGRRLGVAATFNHVSRDASGAYEARLPHPLYLARPRQASGSVDGLSYSERALHLDLVYRLEHGRLRYAVFGGPSHLSVSSELLERVQYQHAFPFDEVQVTSVLRGRSSGSAFGFNVGGEADYRWGARVATVVTLRYDRASLDVPQTDDEAVAVKAGGLQFGAGLRLFLR